MHTASVVGERSQMCETKTGRLLQSYLYSGFRASLGRMVRLSEEGEWEEGRRSGGGEEGEGGGNNRKCQHLT